MQIDVLTLRWDPARATFDDADLKAFHCDRVIALRATFSLVAGLRLTPVRSCHGGKVSQITRYRRRSRKYLKE